ncbi:MAG: hypothetical protein DI537_28425 [Stutzerimonas stutzeri]|nr:MAG: hypothetical protein DI537_28425 [Stutzerimonas stutzeri]
MRAILILFIFIIPSAALAMKFDLYGTGGNCNSCEWLGGEGEINETSVPSLLAAIEKAGGAYPGMRVVLNSPGGSLAAGLKLGQLIRDKKLSTSVGKTIPDPYAPDVKTTVPGKCASACAFAFLGGVDRDTDGGDIGVHQFYQDIALKDPSAKIFDALDLSRQQIVGAMLIEYVHRMGVDPRFVSIASTVAPTQIQWLTADQVKELKVAYHPDAFEPWQIEAYGGGLVAFSRTQDKLKTATLFCGKDRAPKMLLDWPTALTPSDLSNAFQHAETIQVQDVHIPVSASKVVIQNGRAKLTLEMKAALGALAITPPGTLGIALNESKGRYLQGYIPFRMDASGLQRAARLAFRNCI